MPTLSQIAIYPLKSFDPLLVEEARVLENGALEHDRRFAFVTPAGKFLNAKSTAQVHLLEAFLDPESRTLTVRQRTAETTTRWHIDSQRTDLERWFSEYFSSDLTLAENDAGGFPDDEDATGPTIVSTQTLLAVVDWFPGLTLGQIRLRFRANLEIDAPVAFWEDCLFGSAADTSRPFRIGKVVLAGTNPCQRCVVPTRDPATGVIWPEFAKQFSRQRESHLPEWAARDRFNHFYRLTVNTRLIGHGSLVEIGDAVDVLAP